MKVFARIGLFFLMAVPLVSFSQTFLSEGSKEYQYLDRAEIKSSVQQNLNFSAVKPYNRKNVVAAALYLDSLNHAAATPVDLYNLEYLKRNNEEWLGDTGYKPKTYHTLYKTREHLIEVKDPKFFLAVDPMLGLEGGKESNANQSLYLLRYGLKGRAMAWKKLGIDFSISNNSERGPQFFTDRVNQYNAVPGVSNYKTASNGSFNYIDFRGSLSYTVGRYVNLQFGYDKNFLGNGYRSMFLSDYGGSYPFFKINTRIWKLNYENIFAELDPLSIPGVTKTTQLKFMAMHHLSVNVGNNFNVGLFESIISARSNHIDFEYLNPIIFLRQVEGNVGSPDKAHVGLDMKGNVAQHFQLYGQFMLDEFLLHQFLHHTGYWANKWALQMGVKYVDALNIRNLDLQLEANVVRPFTYTHFDPVTNYSTSNQALADPIGANFHELIGILKYQPAPKWNINARIIYYNQGLDSAGLNEGSDIFLDYRTRPRDYGFKIAGGNKATCVNASLNVGYEIFDNLILEASGLVRRYSVANGVGNNNTSFVTLGIRWNMFRREYNY